MIIWIGIVVVIILLALITLLFVLFARRMLILVLNSVLGILGLLGFNVLFNTSIPINVWTVLITAIFGIFGFAFILIAHVAGWLFV